MTPLEATDAWIGPYRLLAELGHGGMGRVYLASAPDGRLVAVKQIDPRYAADEGFRLRFRREADASRRVSGAHTAAVIDADPDAQTPWLASVYVPGPSLREATQATGPLPADSVVHLAARLASALADIHRAGLVHRDLKPANVLLTDDGPRVIDFGIVRALDGDAETTRTAWPVGSPAYMSPEQAQSRPVTAASDMFSLGIVLLVACTGSNPFAVPGDLAETYRNVLHAEPDLAMVPDRLRPIVKGALAKKPGRRPTPAEFLAAIGPVRPSVRLWSPAVHQLIASQQADLSRLLDAAHHGTTVPDAGRTLLAPIVQDGGPDRAAVPAGHIGADSDATVAAPPSARRSRLKLIIALGTVGLVLLLVFAVVLRLGWEAAGHHRPGAGATPSEQTDPPSPSSQPTSQQPTGPITGTVVGYGGKCMDVADGATANKTAVQLYTCNGSAAQRWTMATDGTLSSLGKCLDVTNGDTANGTLVQLYNCNGTGAQQWTARDGQLVNSKSGRCLDDTDGVTTDRTQLDIWDCTNQPNQQWQFG